MKLLTELLSAVFMNAFSKCGYDETLGKVSISDRLDLCQFQCNGALAGAKRYKKAPLMIAQEVANQITGCIYIYKIEEIYSKRLLQRKVRQKIIKQKQIETSKKISVIRRRLF